MHERLITSRNNPTLKRLRSLNNPHKRKKVETFLIEGPKFILDAISAGMELVTVVRDENFHGALPDTGGDIEIITIASGLFREISDTSTSQGLVAEGRVKWRNTEDILEKGRHICIAWGVQDPGNLGTIIRSCAAFGLGGVISGPGSADAFSSKAVRASTGSVLSMPLSSEKDLSNLLEKLRKDGYAVFWTGTGGKTKPGELSKCGRVAFFVGAEGGGLSVEEKGQIGEGIEIGISKDIESLNAGVAASIIAYELTKR